MIEDLLTPTPKSRFGQALSTILVLAAAPLLAFVLIVFVFQSYEVDGPSMEPTLQNRDRLIVSKIPRTIARLTGNDYIPKRGDVVIFKLNGSVENDGKNERQLIKRVIGLPGDHISVRDGKITVFNAQNPDGFNPDMSDFYPNLDTTTPGQVEIDVAEGEIFVCGDNRANSLDSRSFGTVPADQVIGKLKLRIFPIGNAEGF